MVAHKPDRSCAQSPDNLLVPYTYTHFIDTLSYNNYDIFYILVMSVTLLGEGQVMQITNSASNMPYVAPAETDSQNRVQTPQQAEAALQISSSYKVSLPADAKTLNSQQTQANSLTAASQNTNQVKPGLKAQNATRNEQSTSAQLKVAQNTAPAQPAAPAAPAAPAEQPTDLNATQPAAAKNTAQSTAASSPENASASSQPNTTTGNSTSPSTSPVDQPVAPQNQNTPQKPAQEAPMAAAGGMSPGKYSINLSV